MDLSLSGKAVLVTGSSRGIGRATAEKFSDEGARVCLCARQPEPLELAAGELQRKGAVVTSIAADVSTPDGSSNAVGHAVATFGRLDILVNNVGGSLGTGAFNQVEDGAFEGVMQLNLASAVRTSRAAVEHMKSTGLGGVIINIGSIFGREYATSSPYTAAKAALTALTKEMAVDLARYNIRVNSVAPGSILFPGGSWDRRALKDPEKIAQMVERELPFKRFGTPEEVAAAVVFLCSAQASWISGVSLPVDGAQGRAF